MHLLRRPTSRTADHVGDIRQLVVVEKPVPLLGVGSLLLRHRPQDRVPDCRAPKGEYADQTGAECEVARSRYSNGDCEVGS